MLSQKIDLYVSNYQYCIALLGKYYYKNMKIGIKDKSFTYSKYCTNYPCDYFILSVLD